MIIQSQDMDMKSELKAFKEFIEINKYLKRYMNEYILVNSSAPGYLLAFGNSLDYGERVVLIKSDKFKDNLYMENSTEFNDKVKEFRMTKSLLYRGDNLLSVIFQNTGGDIDLYLNNITSDHIEKLVKCNPHFNTIDNPVGYIKDAEFIKLSDSDIHTLRSNKMLDITIDGSSILFSKSILGCLQTTKNSSEIFIAKIPSEYDGKDCWCFKEVIYDKKEDIGEKEPEMIAYLIVYTIGVKW